MQPYFVATRSLAKQRQEGINTSLTARGAYLRGPLVVVAFDLLWLNGEDLRPLPLVERTKRLKRLLARRSNHLIAKAMVVEGRGKALMAAVEQHDLEGIVAKRKSDPYRRGVNWWKIKNPAYSQADDGRGDLLNGDRRATRVRSPRTTWPLSG